MRAVVAAIVVVFSLVTLWCPPAATAADCVEGITLSPTAVGKEIAASGRALVRSNGGSARQTFTVHVGLVVPVGTSLFVFANGEPVGTMTVGPGIATLDVSDADGERLPPGVDPVCSIGPVWVTDTSGTALLTGSF